MPTLINDNTRVSPQIKYSPTRLPDSAYYFYSGDLSNTTLTQGTKKDTFQQRKSDRKVETQGRIEESVKDREYQKNLEIQSVFPITAGILSAIAPVRALLSLGGGWLVDQGSKKYTGKTWGENILPDYPGLGEFTNPGYLLGGINLSRNLRNIVKPKFKSDINWGAWNKEIPQNKKLMKEYLRIERKAKSDGSWMKNYDGTPEQFVQERSRNFKKAFPEGYDKMYRGNTELSNTYRDSESKALFGASDRHIAERYSSYKVSNLSDNPFVHPSTFDKVRSGSYVDTSPDGTHLTELLTPKTRTIRVDGKGKSWQLLDNNKYLDQSRVRVNMENIEHRVKDARLAKTPNLEESMYIKSYDSGNTFASTDNYASYIMSDKNAPGKVIIDNVIDGHITPTTVTIVNPWKVPVKSRWYNNGMFDMLNPNIYKSIIPPLLTLPFLGGENKKPSTN